jgi:hypothetical protein
MFEVAVALVHALGTLFRSRASLALEVFALRQRNRRRNGDEESGVEHSATSSRHRD